MRKVDLALWADYDVIGRAKEFDERVKSENEEFNALWEEMRDRSFFLTSMDPETFRRYERMLEISSAGDLEERRKRVFVEWNRRAIWTERNLRKFLDALLGAGAYRLEVQYSKYTLEFAVRIPERFPRWGYLHRRLREIIPANLGMTFRVEIVNRLYFGMIPRSHKELSVPWSHYEGGTYGHGLYIGGIARGFKELKVGFSWFEGGTYRPRLFVSGMPMKGRWVTVSPSVFDRTKVGGRPVFGGLIRVGRWITVCSSGR